MKKLIITTAATLVTVAAFAQGTVAFSNGAFNKISSGETGSASSTWSLVPTTAGLINYGLFYGLGQSTTLSLVPTLGVNSTANAGVIANSGGTTIGALAVPLSTVGESDVWIQIKGWSASYGTDWAAAQAGAAIGNGYFGTTGAAINVGPLGPTTGPGMAFWATASVTNPSLHPGGITLFTTVPEPGTMALAGLGVAAMLIFRRRK